jgi:selenocysteine lyase/cysteine desulfurase
MTELPGTDQFPRHSGRTYLNAASVALMPRAAEEAIVEWQRDVARNGTVNFGENPEETVFEGLHESAARLFGATPDDIAVAASFSELLGSLAWALAPASDTNVVGTEVGFPSTLYPWVRVARRTGCQIRLAPSRDMRVDPDELVGQINEHTAVVCVSHVEFGSGQRFDLKQLAAATHAHDALFVVDATQSAGAIPIDVRQDDIDVLITAGYKWLCGPFGAAVMVLAPHLHTRFDPGLVGFRSHQKLWDLAPVRMELPETARRFEYGTMGYGNAIGLARSMDTLMEVGVERIAAHNLDLATQLIDGLEARGADILSPQAGDERTSIVSMRLPDTDSGKVAAQLNASGVVVSGRNNFVRFSPHLYNTAEDIARALDELDRCLA